MRILNAASGVFSAISAVFAASAVHAQALIDVTDLPRVGKPIQDGLNFQTPATELADDILWFDNFLLVYITIITLLVVAAMVWCFVRYNRSANDTPATFTHNSALEITWTVVPALSLVFIAIFLSLPVLFKQLRIPEADVVIKAIGNQWYWTYEYPEHDVVFDSLMLPKEDLADWGYAEDEFLLATDEVMVIPVNKTIVMQITGSDVIHAWKIPSFGVHMDAVPGRLAEIWFTAETEGLYFGQCSELCGKDHSYMPITVAVVSEDAYNAWLETAVEEFAGDPTSLPGRVQVAAAE